MVKVITYGTYDLLHYGHLRLLERAKALGDYLIVGITSDDYNRVRGKLNTQQSLIERIEAVKDTGLADEIIVEEYDGQKIDDIKRFDVDIFAIGDDWLGHFDYLKEFCRVVYLPRTKGISSSQIRSGTNGVNIGVVGESIVIQKFYHESQYVNGLNVKAVFSNKYNSFFSDKIENICNSYEELLDAVDAVYIASVPNLHYEHIRSALLKGKNVLCEAPIAITGEELKELEQLAKEHGCILAEGIKTAYAVAYARMVVLAKSGVIGDIISVDSTCTSLRLEDELKDTDLVWGSLYGWGPTAMLPIFQLLGTDYKSRHIVTKRLENNQLDMFTKIDFIYDHAVASIKVGKGIKSEGELIVSGTKGYIYIPAPWWKTDYFEVRFEDPRRNKRYFYQLDGEGIRYEQISFVSSIRHMKKDNYISAEVSRAITQTIEDFVNNKVTFI